VSVASNGPESREMRAVSAELDTATGAVLFDKKSLPKSAMITPPKKPPVLLMPLPENEGN
jgi:hypothetical protein